MEAWVCEMISSAAAAVVVKKRTAWDDSVFTFRPRHNNIVGGSLWDGGLFHTTRWLRSTGSPSDLHDRAPCGC